MTELVDVGDLKSPGFCREGSSPSPGTNIIVYMLHNMTNSVEEILEKMLTNHPDIRRTIQGCTNEEIAAMEQILERQLPHEYTQFLQVLGKQPGKLWGEAMYDTRYTTVMKLIQHSHYPPYITIGIDLISQEELVIAPDRSIRLYIDDQTTNLFPSLQHLLQHYGAKLTAA